MRGFIPGLFTSKLLYALPLTSSVWGIYGYAEQERQHLACTKQDMHKLQSLQRQAALLLVDQTTLQLHHPTEEILQSVNWLSVHQLCVYSILMLTYRVLQSSKPVYLSDRLKYQPNSRTSHNNLRVPRANLNICLEGFMSQATRLYNLLPDQLKSEQCPSRFKQALKEWVMANIIVKP